MKQQRKLSRTRVFYPIFYSFSLLRAFCLPSCNLPIWCSDDKAASELQPPKQDCSILSRYPSFERPRAIHEDPRASGLGVPANVGRYPSMV